MYLHIQRNSQALTEKNKTQKASCPISVTNAPLKQLLKLKHTKISILKIFQLLGSSLNVVQTAGYNNILFCSKMNQVQDYKVYTK